MLDISLCMIVKHEALTIERTIESVINIVSEVVIGIDRQSTDGTREIVERLGCKIVDIRLSEELAIHESVDDDPEWGFAKARNEVFAVANHEAWRIVLDGHEIVKNAGDLKKAILEADKKGRDCVDVKIYFEPGNDGIPVSIFNSVRAMAPNIKYANSQHNVPVVRRKYDAPNVIIEHRKRDQAKEARQERNRQRSNATIAGFEQRVKDHPKSSRDWFYLGRAYKENQRFAEASDAYANCLVHSKWDEERWHAFIDSGYCMSRLGRAEECRMCYARAIDECRNRAESYYWLADLAYYKGCFGEAEIWLEKCVSMPMPDSKLFLDARVYMVARHDLLSMVYNHLGKYQKAIEQAKLALKAAPNKRIEKNIEIWENHINAR